jgi:N-methylhydantoinase A
MANEARFGRLVGVDVGGTFTDLFLMDEASGRFSIAKVSSERGDEARGFVNGLAALGDVAALDSIVHGTTVGTNALLERKVARSGLITTAGFRDVLEMRRRDRPKTWGLTGDFRPIISRSLRREVNERVLADGTVLTPVDPDEVRQIGRELLEAGVEAIALVFIHAYANPTNERRAMEALLELFPSDRLSASHRILPEIREFERSSTTALNACLQPIVGTYLAKLEHSLEAQNFGGTFHIVQSNGGVMSSRRARQFPIRTALSGPAAGVIAAAEIARVAGFPDVITGDLGGTSFDVSLVVQGEAALAQQATIDFGLVIRSPMVEITTIGAGGGSIASVAAGGLLQVGPESAGSRPGPVAYGQGNDRPTLTDANIVLGRINASRPIGGVLARLDREAARDAIQRHIAEPLGLSAEAAAEAIVRVANARMAGAIRLVSIERGFDPGRFALVPFGGGGALHAGALLKDVGLKAALVPRYPGVTSAMGCVIADIRHDQVQTLNLTLENVDCERLRQRMLSEAEQAQSVVEQAGLPIEAREIRFEFDMHYFGQTHTVAVPFSVEPGEVFSLEAVQDAFERAYQEAFSHLLPGLAVRVVNLRTTAIGRRPPFDLRRLAPAPEGKVSDAFLGERSVWFEGSEHRTPIYDRLALPSATELDGPAILEQSDATIVIDPGLKARIDAFGNLILERPA